MEKPSSSASHSDGSHAITIEKPTTSWAESDIAMNELKKVARETITLVGGPAAILLQIAHPGVGQGVADHSTLTTRAISRAQYTNIYIFTLIFGTAEEKKAVQEWVNHAHTRVVNEEGAARNYNAKDPDLQLWVAATIYASMVGMYELIYGPLPPARAELVYQAYSIMGTSLQVPREMWPKNTAAFRVYWKEMVENHLHVTPAARGVLDDVFHPKGMPLWSRPFLLVLMPFVRPITSEQLPPSVREQFGLKSTKTSRGIAGLFVSGMACVYPFIPPFMRHSGKTYALWQLRRRMKKRGGKLVRS